MLAAELESHLRRFAQADAEFVAGGDVTHTLAASTGAGTKELMYRLGHASQQAALRYQYATQERDRAVADALDRLIDSTMDRNVDG